jgi:hypothetical protein
LDQDEVQSLFERFAAPLAAYVALGGRKEPELGMEWKCADCGQTCVVKIKKPRSCKHCGAGKGAITSEYQFNLRRKTIDSPWANFFNEYIYVPCSGWLLGIAFLGAASGLRGWAIETWVGIAGEPTMNVSAVCGGGVFVLCLLLSLGVFLIGLGVIH